MQEKISFRLNDRAVEITTDGERMLLWVLRTELGLTGTKYGCGEGFCGACTVLVDGEAVRSCQFPIGDAAGKDIKTIEGLADNDGLHPLQSAFVRHDALQCGYCTPGMILSSYALLRKNPDPSVQEIKEALEDNFCRCGAHTRILKAVQDAARVLREGGTI